MAKNLDGLRADLFATKDGAVACDVIRKLSKQANQGSDQAKQVLADYTSDGRIGHMREFACSQLADSVSESDTHFAKVFQRGLADQHTRYWSMLGYIKTSGSAAYKKLIQLASDTKMPLAHRSQAIQCLATYSKQPFDRNLPSDPGFWKKGDLRLSELKAWAKAGYQNGQGYTPPPRHVALDKPKTVFEKIASRFDKMLAKQRDEQQNLANPTDWLTIAAAEDLACITQRWTLPSVYLDFLTRFSPLQVRIENRKYWNVFQLFGASELIEGQHGYSYNPVTRRAIKTWPDHLVVIASHGGDPFVLDLSESSGKDAPVDTAAHGAGAWKFKRVASSFSKFLESLAK